MLFNELRLHGKLAAKRHPMYEKNKIGKYIMYASFIFWGAYFIFIGIGLAKAISTEVPNMEAYHILNSGLIFALALDFVIRFPFQKNSYTRSKTLSATSGKTKPYTRLSASPPRAQFFQSYLAVPVRAVRSTHSLSFLWNIRSSHLQHRHLVTDGFQRILVSALPYAD